MGQNQCLRQGRERKKKKNKSHARATRPPAAVGSLYLARVCAETERDTQTFLPLSAPRAVQVRASMKNARALGRSTCTSTQQTTAGFLLFSDSISQKVPLVTPPKQTPHAHAHIYMHTHTHTHTCARARQPEGRSPPINCPEREEPAEISPDTDETRPNHGVNTLTKYGHHR